MSSHSLTRTLIRPALAATSSSSILPISTPIKSFSTSSTRRALKESDANRDREHISQEYERVKNETLRSAKEGKGGWKNELASESEANVKADRDETGISQEGVRKDGTKENK